MGVSRRTVAGVMRGAQELRAKHRGPQYLFLPCPPRRQADPTQGLSGPRGVGRKSPLPPDTELAHHGDPENSCSTIARRMCSRSF